LNNKLQTLNTPYSDANTIASTSPLPAPPPPRQTVSSDRSPKKSPKISEESPKVSEESPKLPEDSPKLSEESPNPSRSKDGVPDEPPELSGTNDSFPDEDDTRFMQWVSDKGGRFSGKGVYAFVAGGDHVPGALWANRQIGVPATATGKNSHRGNLEEGVDTSG